MDKIMKNINKYILLQAQKIYPRLVKIRRQIHQYPETGFNEFKTSALVKKCLKDIGLNNIKTFAKTGVVGVLKGKHKGKTIALRADMDALTLKEETGLPYKSKNEGIMHACGHDAHTACLIGAAYILASLKNELKGSIKFIFQPAEESPGGALPMIKEGALKNPKVDAAFALHLFPTVNTAKAALKEGVMTAFADEIKIIFTGKSGHIAYPKQGIDTILPASELMLSLKDIEFRFNNNPDPVIVGIGKITGGTKNNIIAGRTELFGTVRTLNECTRREIFDEIRKAVKEISKKHGARSEIKIVSGYPMTINDKEMTKQVFNSLKNILGEKNVLRLENPSLGGEDFSYFTMKVPSVFIKLGCASKGIIKQLHNNKFCFDERLLKTGAAIHAKVAWEYLK